MMMAALISKGTAMPSRVIPTSIDEYIALFPPLYASHPREGPDDDRGRCARGARSDQLPHAGVRSVRHSGLLRGFQGSHRSVSAHLRRCGTRTSADALCGAERESQVPSRPADPVLAHPKNREAQTEAGPGQGCRGRIETAGQGVARPEGRAGAPGRSTAAALSQAIEGAGATPRSGSVAVFAYTLGQAVRRFSRSDGTRRAA